MTGALKGKSHVLYDNLLWFYPVWRGLLEVGDLGSQKAALPHLFVLG